MIISIASGKGGTGKTTVAVNMALSLDDVQFLDCDVEEPNAHIFLKPRIEERRKAFVPVSRVDEEECTHCGKCSEVCAYNAIAVFSESEHRKAAVMVFSQLCHGCGACVRLCPKQALEDFPKEIGDVETGMAGAIVFARGCLTIGEAMSPPLIRQVKQGIHPRKTVIIDAPPGTSCPVIAAVKESDFCVLVTEPTLFGLHDLRLTVDVLRKLQIPFGVVINRCDLGDDKTEEYCRKENIPVLMRLPFKKEIAQAYSRGEPIVAAFPQYVQPFRDMFSDICRIVSVAREKDMQ